LGRDAHVPVIDVSDPDSIAAAAARDGERERELDALVNNAGTIVEHCKDPSQESLDGIKAVFETNSFGPIRVTQDFVLFLRLVLAARIVMTSSGVGSDGIMFDTQHPFYAGRLHTP
jgi:NAD(P)-dependent dehydrogenase (short-subunit alcohol dehydrogenase family)